MRTVVKTSQAPAAIGPSEQAITFQGVLYTSGQIPLDVNGDLVEGGIEEQTRQCLENLVAVCRAAGTSLRQALKVTIYLTDMEHFQSCNQIYQQYFEHSRPARSCVAVKALPKGALVEIEGIFALEGEQ